ncbi:choice-of-anchor X domain-containing protein [Ferruginibacter profundus]
MQFNKITSALFFSFLIFFALVSCTRKDAAADVPINAAFEMDPPIANDVMIKKIKGDDNNVLMVATFTDTRLKEPFLAFNFDTTKMVMRDDGKEGDEKAGDGLYSAKVNTNVKEFEQTARGYYKLAAGARRFVFKGRSIIADTINTAFDARRFNDGDFVSIKNLPPPPAPAALKDHSLMITDLNVVEDPARTFNFCTQTGNIDGAWTFKTLMKNLAATSPGAVVTDVQLSDFVDHFFAAWLNVATINGDPVSGRIEMHRSMQGWVNKSQTLPPPRVPVGKMDMRAIPFKLMAIVNRLDLRGNSGYGFSNAGEARLVFCMMRPDGCTPMPFTIIFEYGVPKKNCAAVKAFAQEWYDLNTLAFTDPQYNIKLQAITDQFTLAGTSPSKPNQNSINQVRTDEFALAVPPWELREFHLSNTTHMLEPAAVKQTPANMYNAKVNNADVQRLAAYINGNEPAILANNYTVPDNFSGHPFLGGHAFTGQTSFPIISPVGMPSGIAPHHWNGTVATGSAFINNSDARQIFSINTCSGCHGGETQTAFTMIDPVPFGTQATLSGFLTGTPGSSFGAIAPVDLDGNNGIMNVPDPAGRASSNLLRRFNDLQRRADDLQVLVSSSCKSVFTIRDILIHAPLRFTE